MSKPTIFLVVLILLTNAAWEHKYHKLRTARAECEMKWASPASVQQRFVETHPCTQTDKHHCVITIETGVDSTKF